MTIEEIEKWLIKKEESFDMNQIPPPTHKIIRDLLAQVREARKQVFLDAAEMANSRWDAIGKPQNSIDTGEKVALIMFSRALRRKAEEE